MQLSSLSCQHEPLADSDSRVQARSAEVGQRLVRTNSRQECEASSQASSFSAQRWRENPHSPGVGLPSMRLHQLGFKTQLPRMSLSKAAGCSVVCAPQSHGEAAGKASNSRACWRALRSQTQRRSRQILEHKTGTTT